MNDVVQLKMIKSVLNTELFFVCHYSQNNKYNNYLYCISYYKYIGECVLIIYCRYCVILYKELEHPQI